MQTSGSTDSSLSDVETRIRGAAPHLVEKDVFALTEIVRRLIAAYEPERIYLFGSKARGDDGPDSDFDLMIVVPDQSASDRCRSSLAYSALRGTGVAADVLVHLRSAFDSRAHVVASLPATILREGRLLYAA